MKKTKQTCHVDRTVSYTQPENSTASTVGGAVVGGVAGGLLGSMVKGNSHNTAVAAGAVLGAATGAGVQNYRNQPEQQVQETQRCTPVTVTTHVQKGYQVTYTYQGQQAIVLMTTAPLVNSQLPLSMVAPTSATVIPSAVTPVTVPAPSATH